MQTIKKSLFYEDYLPLLNPMLTILLTYYLIEDFDRVDKLLNLLSEKCQVQYF